MREGNVLSRVCLLVCLFTGVLPYRTPGPPPLYMAQAPGFILGGTGIPLSFLGLFYFHFHAVLEKTKFEKSVWWPRLGNFASALVPKAQEKPNESATQIRMKLPVFKVVLYNLYFASRRRRYFTFWFVTSLTNQFTDWPPNNHKRASNTLHL